MEKRIWRNTWWCFHVELTLLQINGSSDTFDISQVEYKFNFVVFNTNMSILSSELLWKLMLWSKQANYLFNKVNQSLKNNQKLNVLCSETYTSQGQRTLALTLTSPVIRQIRAIQLPSRRPQL